MNTLHYCININKVAVLIVEYTAYPQLVNIFNF